MTPAESWYRAQPDTAFPVVEVPHQLMVAAVQGGWATRVRCWGCDRVVDISPRDLCALFGRQILGTVQRWAEGLRCQRCGARRAQVYHVNHPGSQAEFGTTAWTVGLSQVVRLEALLPLAGVQLEEVIPLLRDLPEPDQLRIHGLAAAAAAVERARGASGASRRR